MIAVSIVRRLRPPLSARLEYHVLPNRAGRRPIIRIGPRGVHLNRGASAAARRTLPQQAERGSVYGGDARRTYP